MHEAEAFEYRCGVFYGRVGSLTAALGAPAPFTLAGQRPLMGKSGCRSRMTLDRDNRFKNCPYSALSTPGNKFALFKNVRNALAVPLVSKMPFLSAVGY